jgi:hypothetical protein
VQLRFINFLCCVILIHNLLKCVITVFKLNLSLSVRFFLRKESLSSLMGLARV